MECTDRENRSENGTSGKSKNRGCTKNDAAKGMGTSESQTLHSISVENTMEAAFVTSGGRLGSVTRTIGIVQFKPPPMSHCLRFSFILH